jgi:two-component system cell cycle sensor histidine kinase/response regulator CckA
MSERNRETGSALSTSDQLAAAEHLVLEMIASGAPLDGVLRALAAFIDLQTLGGMSAIRLFDPVTSAHRLDATAALPQSFIEALDRMGGPEPAIAVSDAAADPRCEDRRDLLLGHGLRSFWSSSIRTNEGAALGTVTIYYTRQHVPEDREITPVDKASRLAAMVIERNRMEAGRERFRALVEHTSDILAIMDENGIVRYLSPSAERILGFHPSEVVGTSTFDYLHPADVQRGKRAFEETLARLGPGLALEQRVRHKDGSWRVIETINNNQLNDPAIAGVIVTGRDITAWKATEEDLISSQEQYRELFENANDIIYTHDLAGRLTSLNKAGELLIGYSREETLGMNVSGIVAEEYKTLLREMTERKIGGEAKTTYEVEIVTKQGVRIPLELSTRLIFQMGKPVAVQGIARDITERRRIESHLVQSQKMEAIGRLAGGVAHDFNNLLTVIAGYSQWMVDDLPKDSEFAESASEILLAANRAAALTNQLLAFSRNQVIQPVIVNLNSLVAELDPMLRRVIGEDIEMTAVMSPDLGLVKADPGQIEQVILNLVVNARDAMPTGGKLAIETANAEIDESYARLHLDCPPGPYIMLTVSDSGCGIDDRVKPHIFDPFFTTKETGKGTGLGLSTVYGIVKQCGGCVRVESEPGAGALFTLYFPRVAGAVLASGTSRRGSRKGGSETILLVEDEAAVRRIAAGRLLRLGYTVLQAANGRTALKMLEEYTHPIHLLLTDVVMPDLSGRELAAQLKAARRDLKVLFMSGYAGDVIVQRGLLEPGTAYMQKPFSLDTLAGKVRDLLDGG